MSPHVLALRTKRNEWAIKLLTAIDVHSDCAKKLEVVVNSQMPVAQMAMSQVFIALQNTEAVLLAQVNFSIQKFQEAQDAWQREIDGKDIALKAALTKELKDIKFDWSRRDNLGPQIDAANLRWGSFTVAALGGEKTSATEQIALAVAGGATEADYLEILRCLGHMPQVLGASQYRHACLLGIGLTLRANRRGSSLDEVNQLLQAFDRAQRMLAQAEGIAQETIDRLIKRR